MHVWIKWGTNRNEVMKSVQDREQEITWLPWQYRCFSTFMLKKASSVWLKFKEIPLDKMLKWLYVAKCILLKIQAWKDHYSQKRMVASVQM